MFKGPRIWFVNESHANGIEILERMKTENKFKKKLIKAIISNSIFCLSADNHAVTTENLKKVLSPAIITTLAKVFSANYDILTENKQRNR